MESFGQCYEIVADHLREKITETSYNIFISGIEPVSFENGVATLSIASDFLKTTVQERYQKFIEESFEDILGFPVAVNIVSRESMSAGKNSPLKGMLPPVLSGEYAYTFDTFIVGGSNRFAHAAAQAVAANPAGAYNPLFIYGDSGLGKTHLLMAIKNDLLKTHPEYKILYVEGERFTNELIAAITQGNTEPFHKKYRSADVLLVDDIQFIGGKVATEEEFFHTFNSLYKHGKQIVLSSDRPPKEIKSLTDRLRTRFESGLLADISAPDLETRISILRRKASFIGLELTDDVAEYVASHIKENIRQLEGVVKKLYAYQLMNTSKPNLTNAQAAIKDLMQEQRPIPITIEKILEEISRTFNVSTIDIRSNKRDSDIANARQISMYVIREVTGMTMEDIGAEFSNRNHSTVTHSIKKVERLLDTNSHLKNMVGDIIKNAKI